MNKFSYYLRIIAAHIILFSLSFNVIIASDYFADFFDVGQGHCFIARTKHNGVLIVDAGSSSTVGVEEVDGGEAKYEQLATKIFESIEDDIKTLKKLSFIITHADQDHLNLVKPIISEQDKKKSKLKKVFQEEGISLKVILGGTEEDYMKKDALILVNFLKDNDIPYVFGDEFNSIYEKKIKEEEEKQKIARKQKKKIERVPLQVILQDCNPKDLEWIPPRKFSFVSNHEEKITFLSVRADSAPTSKGKNANDSSIVLKIQLGKWAIMITGDKTKSEIGTLIGNYSEAKLLGELKSDVLLATHHGSETDFDPKWMRIIHPSIYILSAGNSQHTHPRYKATCSGKVLKNLSNGSWEWHPIRSFGNISQYKKTEKLIPLCAGKKHNINNESYSYCMTNTGIYSTADQGTIKLLFKGDNIEVKPSRQEGNKSLEEATKNFLGSEADKWRNLVIYPEIPLSSIEQHIANHCTTLKKLDLRYYNAKDEDTLPIARIITALQGLSKIDLKSDTLSEKSREEIRKAWGNRGLNFINSAPTSQSNVGISGS